MDSTGKSNAERQAYDNVPLKVKNTFIDIEAELDDGKFHGMEKRQVSEPAPLAASMTGSSHGMASRNRRLSEIETWPEVDVVTPRVDGEDQVASQALTAPATVASVATSGSNGTTQESVSALAAALAGLMPTASQHPSAGAPHTAVATAARAAAAAAARAASPTDFAGAIPPNASSCGVPAAGSSSMTVPFDPHWPDTTTTVMMRNLPNKYTQRMLLTEINTTGFLGTFDFIYLPIDMETNANRGYCFVNFVDPGSAWMFKMTYEGRKMNHFNSTKLVSVMPATLQGFEANYVHYSTARVSRGDPAARPLFLREPPSSFINSMQRGQRRPDGRRNNGKQMAVRQLQQAQQAQQAEQVQQSQQATYLGAQSAWPDDSAATGVTAGGDSTSAAFFGLDADYTQAAPTGCGAASARPQTGPPMPRFCPNCGGAIQPFFQFCPQCGGSLECLAATV